MKKPFKSTQQHSDPANLRAVFDQFPTRKLKEIMRRAAIPIPKTKFEMTQRLAFAVKEGIIETTTTTTVTVPPTR